jgi:hypothetical protein
MRSFRYLACVAMLGVVSACSHEKSEMGSGKMERSAKWVMLFDGKDLAGWHTYRQPEGTTPKNWKVTEEGALLCYKKGGDIISDGTYGNFVLDLDYKVEKGVNSGIIYRCDESEKACWQTGVEYQLIDNGDKNPLEEHMNAAAYALYGCSVDANKPVGEWNHAKIVADGTHVQHWLNGVKVVEYDTASDDFREREEKSKFHVYKNFAKLSAGHIAFQGDHSENVSFKNVKLMALPAK